MATKLHQTAADVKGVSQDRPSPNVVSQPYRPERQFMSKDDVLKAKEAEKKANAAGEAAKSKVLAEHGIKATDPVEKEKKAESEKIELVRRQLANAEKNLSDAPKSAAWKAKVKSLSEDLEVLESKEE